MRGWWRKTCVETYLASRSHPESSRFDVLIILLFGVFGVAMIEEPTLLMALTPASGVVLYLILTGVATVIGGAEVRRRIAEDPARSQAWRALAEAVERCASAGLSLDRDKLTDEQRDQVLDWLDQARRMTTKLEEKLSVPDAPNPYTYPEAQRAVLHINDLTGKIQALQVRETA